MTTPLEQLLASLPTADDVGRWEDLSSQLGVEIAELSEKKRRIDQLIERAKLIFAPHEGPQYTEVATPSAVESVAEPDKKAADRMPKGSWMNALHDIARAHPKGIPYDEAKEALPSTLKEQLARGNTKAFYGALRRLERDGYLIRFNSHFFTPEGFEEFRNTPEFESLERKGSAKRGSPISDEIKAYLAQRGPSKALAIKEHLCAIPEFRGPLKRNKSALYNVLKNLVDREELTHDRDNALFSLSNVTEAPNGDAVGASGAGEVGASPTDSQSTLRLIG